MFLTAVASQSSSAPLFHEATTIVYDATMGRCLCSNRNFKVGDAIFKESALIYSTYDGKNPHEAELIRSSFPRIVIDRMPEILDDLANLNRVQSLDTAKNFVLLLSMQRLRNIGKTDVILRYYRNLGISLDELQEKLARFDELTAANLSECISDIRSIRQDYPKLISQDITTEEAARLLGIVTTNQLELEELGGSGMFVNTAILQHDCSPNCSYTTNGTTLYMTAIQDIEAGQRLSIDYGNNFYQPTPERRESLLETYGFSCNCATCAGPDKKRPYKCPVCKAGMFFPIGASTISEQTPTPCTHCGCVPTAEHCAACTEREHQLLLQPPTTLVQYSAHCAEGLLHDAHYVFFHALDEMYLKLTGEARSNYFDNGSGQSLRLYSEALVALRQCIALLEWQLPAVHHEKVVYYDRLGQLAVAVGDAALAKESYGLAYQHSVQSSGANTPATLAVLKLAENPPTLLAELLEHYSAREIDGEEQWEDMDEDA